MTINNQNNLQKDRSLKVLWDDIISGILCIGCDATNPKAIKKVYSIKKRSTEKPLILLMNNADLLLNYVELYHRLLIK